LYADRHVAPPGSITDAFGLVIVIHVLDFKSTKTYLAGIGDTFVAGPAARQFVIANGRFRRERRSLPADFRRKRIKCH
jgi:hypothetical protein